MSTVVTTRPRTDGVSGTRPAESRGRTDAKSEAPVASGWSLTINLSGKAAAGTDLVSLLDLPQEVRDRQQKSKDLLAQLEQAGKAMIGDRKAAAQQKLDQARAKLQMLRMFGGDPKAMARQARQIAQEIREAARDYGAALKAEGGGVAATPQVPATPAAPAAPSEGDAAANGADPATASDDGKAGEGGQTGCERLAEGYRNAAAEIASKGDKARAEREAIDKFKQAADEARRLIEEAIRKLRAQKAHGANDPLVDELEKAKGSMVKAVGELDDAASGGVAAAPAGGMTVAPPSVDILA